MIMSGIVPESPLNNLNAGSAFIDCLEVTAACLSVQHSALGHASTSSDCPCCNFQVAEKEIGESDEEESEVKEMDVDLVEKARVGLPKI